MQNWEFYFLDSVGVHVVIFTHNLPYTNPKGASQPFKGTLALQRSPGSLLFESSRRFG